MANVALITGITGQDGSYLAELLLGKGYEVHGIVRRTSLLTRSRIDHLRSGGNVQKGSLSLHYGDLTDASSITNAFYRIRPDEVYNLGAQSHVAISFEMPEFTVDSTGMCNLRLLEAIRHADWPVRFYQAGSSEMFGAAREHPQRETTPFHPKSPYAIAKVLAHHMTILYREAYGVFACNGILFNHESPRRGANFVTRKVTLGIAQILSRRERKLFLGKLDAYRDWGYAPEYVEAMWLMLQQVKPDDYVIATGETHSVREFVETAFGYVGLHWEDYVEIDPQYFRPAEVDKLCGDSSKAAETLGWKPRTTFDELVRKLVKADLVDVGINPDRYFTDRG